MAVRLRLMVSINRSTFVLPEGSTRTAIVANATASGGADMRSFEPMRTPHPSYNAMRIFVAGWMGIWFGSVGAPTGSRAQELLPADRQEIADQERLSWTLSKFPPQPYMKELYWQYSKDTPAFFRDSLVQYVARTYY